MKEQFVSYEIALKLKELGFDEPCIAYWRDGIDDLKPVLLSEFVLDHSKTVYYTQCGGIEISAPLWQQVIDWFREDYDIHIVISPFNDEEVSQILYEFTIYESDWNDTSDYTYYHSYEEAREQAILKCIELIENKNGA